MSVTERRKYLRESDFLRAVTDCAIVNGWLAYHVDNSTRLIQKGASLVRVRNTPRGFPDLCLVRERDARLIFAELKRDVGPRGGGSRVATRPEQDEWLRALRAVEMQATHTIGVYVWRPADWPEIERVLAWTR